MTLSLIISHIINFGTGQNRQILKEKNKKNRFQICNLKEIWGSVGLFLRILEFS